MHYNRKCFCQKPKTNVSKGKSIKRPPHSPLHSPLNPPFDNTENRFAPLVETDDSPIETLTENDTSAESSDSQRGRHDDTSCTFHRGSKKRVDFPGDKKTASAVQKVTEPHQIDWDAIR